MECPNCGEMMHAGEDGWECYRCDEFVPFDYYPEDDYPDYWLEAEREALAWGDAGPH